VNLVWAVFEVGFQKSTNQKQEITHRFIQ